MFVFETEDPEDLKFNEGDVIEVISPPDLATTLADASAGTVWCTGHVKYPDGSRSAIGSFPSNYVCV